MDLTKLNERELQVFNRIGMGIKAARIAQELKISVNTVHVYRFRILRTLGLSSTTELVKRWILEQILDASFDSKDGHVILVSSLERVLK